jgi:hypothetical protein
MKRGEMVATHKRTKKKMKSIKVSPLKITFAWWFRPIAPAIMWAADNAKRFHLGIVEGISCDMLRYGLRINGKPLGK